MAQAAAVKKPAPAPAEAQPEAPPAEALPAPKKKSLLVPIIAAVLVVAVAGGGAAWYFLHGKDAADESPAANTDKPPVFVPLDQFTVNLLPDEGNSQYLQVALTLKVADEATVDAIKLRLPEIRNGILLLLSSKKAAEISSLDGKQKLADEVAQQVTLMIQPKAAPAKRGAPARGEAKPAAKGDAKGAGKHAEPEARIQAVLFTHFIIQ